ncbi:MAG: metal-dependent transcriptional regulator [Fervidobacterium sp.]|uniref:metal-dependent transcriptional regulator n=1 Tax=Fervidobacterium sp. TaxID=1871331 RepID=UPI00404AE46E
MNQENREIRELREGKREKLTPTVMSYISAIYTLIEREGVARVSDIAKLKEVSYASATNAVKKLSSLGLVEHKRYGFAKLTQRGLRIAQMLKSGESRIKYFFMYVVGIPQKKAEQIASLMVYDLDAETRRKLRKFYSILIDFTKDRCEELEKFIKEHRMNSELPEEAFRLKDKIKEDEDYE